MTEQTNPNSQTQVQPQAVNAALRASETANRNVAALADRINAFVSASPQQNTPQAEQPRELSWGELRQAVAQGKITEDAATEYWQKQNEQRTQKLIQDSLSQAFKTREAEQSQYDEIDQYRRALPGLDAPNSPLRQKAEEAHAYLVSQGMKKDAPETEIAALRAAFGLPHQLRGQRRMPQRFSDVGASNGGDPPARRPGADLSPDRRRHYDYLISKGRYSGWTDPKLVDELKYIRQPARLGR